MWFSIYGWHRKQYYDQVGYNENVTMEVCSALDYKIHNVVEILLAEK